MDNRLNQKCKLKSVTIPQWNDRELCCYGYMDLYMHRCLVLNGNCSGSHRHLLYLQKAVLNENEYYPVYKQVYRLITF